MNRQKQNEAMARIELGDSCKGFTHNHLFSHFWVKNEKGSWNTQHRDYDDLNVLHQIICGMDDDTHGKYAVELCRLMAGTDEESFFVNAYAPMEAVELLIRATKATPKQIREALLKAHGKWDENEEQDND